MPAPVSSYMHLQTGQTSTLNPNQAQGELPEKSGVPRLQGSLAFGSTGAAQLAPLLACLTQAQLERMSVPAHSSLHVNWTFPPAQIAQQTSAFYTGMQESPMALTSVHRRRGRLRRPRVAAHLPRRSKGELTACCGRYLRVHLQPRQSETKVKCCRRKTTAQGDRLGAAMLRGV